MTSNSSSLSSSQVAAIPIWGWKEDVLATGSILAVAPPIVAASAVEAPSGAGMSVSHPAPPAVDWGPPSSVVLWDPDPLGGGVRFGLDGLGSKSNGQ
jgi:hypothetical protein